MGLLTRSRTPASLAARLGMSLFFSVFLVMGLVFLGLMGKELGKVVGARQWKATPAVILFSDVVEKAGGENPFVVEVNYRYEWEGTAHTSDRFQLTIERFADYSKAYGRIADLPAGTATVCYVNPGNPGEAVIRRPGWGMGFFFFLPLIFVVVGAGGIYGVWAKPKEKSRPLSTGQGLKKDWTGVLFGGVFAAVGLGLLVFWFLPALTKTLDAQGWTQTPCTVISSGVKSHSGKKGTTYSVNIFYRYAVGEKEFKSNRYRVMSGSSSGRTGKEAVVARYPAGSQQVCFVNPRNPAEAVLQPAPGWEMVFGLLPLIFAGVGLFIIWASLKGKQTGREAAQERPALPASGELKARTTPVGRLLGMFVIAVFWNGIVALFLWQAFSGRQEPILTLILIPFVLVGLGLIGAVGYFVLALANPRCCLRVTPPVIRPGQSVEVAWTLTGAVQRLRRLRIFLEGKEEVTFRRGKSTCTDRHVFAKLTIAEMSHGLEMNQGEARCLLPEDLPPSWKASHNRILWTIRVHGEVPGWPDMNEEFEIQLLPKGSQ